MAGKVKIFKHRGFNEQLSNVSINYVKHIQRRIGYKDEEEEEAENTYTYECLQKWLDLDCTEQFFQLQYQMGGLLNVRTLPQLLHRREQLLDAIYEHLAKFEHASFPALIELVIALAKDLQHDFYPYFEKIFILLVRQLATQKVEIIENVFLAFAYLFKILWKSMLKNLSSIFHLYAEHLLLEKRDYIVMFSAQSFAFLVRKCTDYNQLVEMCLMSVQERPSLANGVGYLLFETVKSIHGQLHSCSEDLLPALFKVHAERKSNVSEAQCVHYCLEAILTHVQKPDFIQPVWKALIPMLTKYSETNFEAQLALFRILQIICSQRRCIFVNDANELIRICTQTLDTHNNLQIQQLVIDISCDLLENASSGVTVRNVQNFVNICIQQSQETVLHFFEQILSYRFFERDILPSICKYVDDQKEPANDDRLNTFLCNLILQRVKRPVLAQTWVKPCKYVLHIGESYLKATLSQLQQDFDLNDETVLQALWMRLVIVPHLTHLNNEDLFNTLTCVYNQIEKEILKEQSLEQMKKLTFMLFECIFALLMIESNSFSQTVKLEKFVDMIKKNPQDYGILRSLDLYLQWAKQETSKEDVFKLSLFESIYPDLQANFTSCHSLLRMASLSICCLFEPTLPPENIQIERELVFQICLKTEQVPLMNFKEKMRLVNKLQYGLVSKCVPIPSSDNCTYEYAALHYLLGSLYINCTPLWTNIQSAINTYAIGMKDSTKFWSIYMDHVNETEQVIANTLGCGMDNAFSPLQGTHLFYTHINAHLYHEDRADYLNHRLQLVNTLKQFPHVIEKHNRLLVDWFFDYVNRESDIVDINFASHTENISKPNHEPISLDETDEQEDFVQENQPKAIKSDKVSKAKRLKTLVAFLSLLSKFRNPNALHSESKLRALYLDFLKSRFTEVQKEAYNCIRAYKWKYLSPYYENVENLIDTSEFKSEMVRFNVSSTNEEDIVLHEQHRADLVPILMRILYGKMLHDFSSSREGLTDAKLKKKLIFRYIAGFKENEIRVFISIAFSRFEHLASLDIQEAEAEITKSVNPQQAIPLKQLFSSLQNLDYMLDNLAALCPTQLPLFFRLLLIMLKYVNSLLEKRALVTKAAIHQLKQLRSDTYKALCKFFENYDDYNHSTDEINALFRIDIEHTLPNLFTFSKKTINPQLRLFSIWCENANYFKYLIKPLENHDSLNALSEMMKLYQDKNTNHEVVGKITKSLNSLLTLESSDDADQEISFGTKIVIPYVSVIIDRFEQSFSRKLAKRKAKIVTEKEGEILLLIGKYVSEEKSCARLVRLLIASLPKNIIKRDGDTDLATFTVLAGLCCHLQSNWRATLVSLVPFFDLIKDKSSRQKLCEVFASVSDHDVSLSPLNEMVQNLNAYNRSALGAPDYERCIEGFKQAKELLQSSEWKTDSLFLSLVIKTAVHFIKHGEDFAIRSQAISTLTEICKELAALPERRWFNTVCVEQLLFKEIRIAFKHSDDLVKQDFVSVLKEIIALGEHKYCKQMSLLATDDPETDFWTNVFNIQIHRRTRANYQILNQVELLEQISLDVIMTFMLPMVMNNVLDPTYSKNDALRESSINVIGVLCRYLDWKSYVLLLKQQLNKLESEPQSHKIFIKLICTVLNNFTFDLSKVEFSKIQVSSTSTLVQNLKIKNDSTANTNEEAEDDDDDEEDDDKDEQSFQNLNRQKDNAEEIYKTIVSLLLPKLHQTLHKSAGAKITYEDNRKVFAEDEEILRMPIAIAMVKLLKVLPEECKLLENNIRGIVLRVANFLKSRAISIRDASRKTLITITQMVGPYYLNYILVELRSLLTRGYMFHVLTFTVCALLESLSSQFGPQDLDPSIELLVGICEDELFSDLAEEKDVVKITTKVVEARKVKSYEIFRFIGKYISTHNLVQVYRPFKERLIDARSHKILVKIDNCLQKMCVGLIENKFIEIQHLLLFKYSSLQDTVPQLQLNGEVKKVKSRYDRPDQLLIAPTKKIKVVRSDVRANLHVLILHHLQTLHLLLKRISGRKLEQKLLNSMLQPFVPILIEQLNGSDPRLIAMSLRCLRSVTRKNMSSVVNAGQLVKVKNQVFVLLNRYGSYVHGENVDMKSLCFKMVTALLSDVSVKISADQLRILLFYVDQDLGDSARQAQAFAVLNSILDRQLQCDELHEMLSKLRELLVQSSVPHIRQRCRVSWFKYLLNYPVGGRLDSSLLFFTKQLEYEHASGRESVMRLFNLLIRFCPNVVLFKLNKLSLVALASRIVNDEDGGCRRLSAKCLFGLLNKLAPAQRDAIFKGIFLSWFNSDNYTIRQLGTHVIGILCDVEKANFVKERAKDILPKLASHLEPSQYTEVQDNLDSQRSVDHLQYTLFVLLKKILKHLPIFVRSEEAGEALCDIWQFCISTYLKHSHVWIRVSALELFEQMLLTYSNQQVLEAMTTDQSSHEYLLRDPINVLWSYFKCLTNNLMHIYEIEAHGELVMRGFTNLALLFSDIEKCEDEILTKDEEQYNLLQKLRCTVLIKRLVDEVNREVRMNDRLVTKRRFIYAWLREIIKYTLDDDQVNETLQLLIEPLVRDVTDRHLISMSKREQSDSFITITQRVLNVLKNRTGEDRFNRHYTAALLGLNKRRTKRKTEKAMSMVLNPMLAMKMKARKRLQSRNLKKRKAESTNGYRTKRPRRSEF